MNFEDKIMDVLKSGRFLPKNQLFHDEMERHIGKYIGHVCINHFGMIISGRIGEKYGCKEILSSINLNKVKGKAIRAQISELISDSIIKDF